MLKHTDDRIINAYNMDNYWKRQGVPHKGWTLERVYDVRENGQSEEETTYEICMMCGHEKIRYVHVVTHHDHSNKLLVGCQCAERLTEDYINPQRIEKELRNKYSRLIRFIKRPWKISDKGNEYLNIGDHHILIREDKQSHIFTVKIDDIWGQKQFKTSEQAKTAAFKGIEYYKAKDEW